MRPSRSAEPFPHVELPADTKHAPEISLSQLRGHLPIMVAALYANAHAGVISVDQALPMLEGCGAFKPPVRANVIKMLDKAEDFRRTAHLAPTYELVR